MPDLYLQALMQGELVKQGVKSLASRAKKNRFEIEIEKQIDEYLKTIEPEEYANNPFMTPAMKIAQVREEMRSACKLTELSKYVEDAFKILSTESSIYLSEERQNALSDDFTSAVEQLDNIDMTNPLNENLQTALHLSDTTLESIIKVATAKYNENKISDSLALYVLLSTLNPEYPEYWYRAGITAHADQNFQLALKLYNAAFTLDPEFLGARVLSVECYLSLQLLDEAKIAYIEAKSLSETMTIEEEWNQILQEHASAIAA